MLHDIAILEKEYQTKTSNQIAQEVGMKPSKVRRKLSEFGVRSVRRERTKARRGRVRKFVKWGWTVSDIAEQEMVSKRIIRMDILRCIARQLALWPKNAFRIAARPMRIVHARPKPAACPYVQLSIPFPLEQQALAA